MANPLKTLQRLVTRPNVKTGIITNTIGNITVNTLSGNQTVLRGQGDVTIYRNSDRVVIKEGVIIGKVAASRTYVV